MINAVQMRSIVIPLLWAAACCAGAAPIDSLFVNAPQAVLPLLDRNARLNLLDFYHAGMAARAENRLGGEARLLELSDVHLVLSPVEGSRWELVRVPWRGDSAVVCLHTLSLPAEDTRVRLFSEDWQPLPALFPEFEDVAEFWAETDSLSADRRRELRAQLVPLHVVWSWNPATPAQFVASVSLAGVYAPDAADLRPCLRSLAYRWTADGRLERLSVPMRGEEYLP
ncbi:MAG: DUF3256 family protein [Bacteroidales bacterium]|nr:DUF3256 family protein [Bacteroidales bacterium]